MNDQLSTDDLEYLIGLSASEESMLCTVRDEFQGHVGNSALEIAQSATIALLQRYLISVAIIAPNSPPEFLPQETALKALNEANSWLYPSARSVESPTYCLFLSEAGETGWKDGTIGPISKERAEFLAQGRGHVSRIPAVGSN